MLPQILIPAALNLLPERMRGPSACRILAAIGYQESDWEHRRQLGNGPARGWWQFEPIGVAEVFRHPATRDYARNLAETLRYQPDPEVVYHAIADSDLLACGVARLALWRHPHPMPTRQHDSWDAYLDIWRPGKPRPDRWPSIWRQAAELWP